MYTKQDLIQHIQIAGIKFDDTLLIHSSMKAIGPVDGRADTVLDAFAESLVDGLLVLPTHTWERIGRDYPIFDPETEPSCVGVLPEIFRKRPGVIRSFHPTHSVAALGKDAPTFTSGEEHWDTPLPRQGCWGKLYDRDAKILFFGAPLTTNTILHGVEEWAEIPHRLTDDFEPLQIRIPGGQVIPRPMRRHHAPVEDISKHYGKMEQPLLQVGIAKRVQIGDATSVLCQVRPTVDFVTALLRNDPDLFLDNEPIPQEAYPWFA